MNKVREYSIPLIGGVMVALIFANIAPELYHHIIHLPIIGDKISLHWLVNDIFMVLFFASAGVEIVNSLSPGGPLNPLKKAVTPLMATAGGVIGPILVFFILNGLFGAPEYANGWGVTTATDIALAWLIARFVFGAHHPAVSFLLLLAVADDAIGLIIIAVFYPDPNLPVKPEWLGLCVVAMVIANFMKKKDIKTFWPYILIPGMMSWIGMHNAHLHPALAFVLIVPFLPNDLTAVEKKDTHGPYDAAPGTTLHKFEHFLSPIVDYGLFFFGFANAGVPFSEVSTVTFIIFGSLILGKMLGVTTFTYIAAKGMKFGLPEGMLYRHVPLAGIIAGLGLTVALFVAESAYTDIVLQGSAKMGALLSVFAGIIAIIVGHAMKIKRITQVKEINIEPRIPD